MEMRMLAILPSAFTEAHYDAGYRSAIDPAAEFSLAQGLGRPMSGRVFFEWVIGGKPRPWPSDRVSSIVPRQDYRPSPTGRPSPHRARLPHRVVVSARLFYARR